MIEIIAKIFVLKSFKISNVLSHKAATHLRSKGLDLEWYQYYMLDVLLIVIY